MGVSRDVPNFFEYPLLSQERVKLRTSIFGRYIHRVHPNKTPFKILGKRNVDVSRDDRNFYSTPYYFWNG